MRLPLPLAWLMLILAFFTAGLLRRFHGEMPGIPGVPTAVGSLLFIAIVLFFLIAAREWRRGAVGGPGIRLGSLTPLLLMLLIEKWVSLNFYGPLFGWLTPAGDTPEMADARFRAYAGIGLVLVCLAVARFSTPTARKTCRRSRPARLPGALLQTAVVILGTYVILAALAAAMGGGLRLEWPPADVLLIWILTGQAVLAFGEELYYRGLLMCEVERLAPRLGVSSAALRRWIALLFTSVLFAMEHLDVTQPLDELVRRTIFTASLGTLLGLLIMVSANIHLGAGMHAWINWLLLGAAPHFVNHAGEPVLPAGTYIGLTLVLAFVTTYVFHRVRHRPRPAPQGGS